MDESELNSKLINRAVSRIRMPHDKRREIIQNITDTERKATTDFRKAVQKPPASFIRRVMPATAITMFAIVCISLVIHNIPGYWVPDFSGEDVKSIPADITEEESFMPTEEVSDPASKIDLTYYVTLEVPKWYGPGILKAYDLSLTEWGSDFLPGVVTGEYIYINDLKSEMLRTGEHLYCKYFRLNTSSGKLECLDHEIRDIMKNEGIIHADDEIYMDHSSNCTDRYLMFYINHFGGDYRGSFVADLVERTFYRIPLDLRKDMDWQIDNDHKYLVVGEYSDRWRYYKIDLMTDTKTEILETENNSTYSFGLSKTNRYFWYATYHGQSKDTWNYYDLTSGERRSFNTTRMFCVTPDDKYVVYIRDLALYRLDLETGEDTVLVEELDQEFWDHKSIYAYDPVSGRVLLDWGSMSSGAVLYVYDTVLQKSEKLVGFDESLDIQWGENEGIEYQENSCADEADSLRNSAGTDSWIMDTTGKYLFFYCSAPKHDRFIYCYGMSSGELFKVALPDDFYKRMSEETKDRYDSLSEYIVEYKLVLSEDGTGIYLTYQLMKRS